jgi:hypothetical protein
MTQLAAGLPATGLPGSRATLVLLLALAGCAEPFIVMSGGALSGTVVDPPPDWTEVGAVDVVQLEVQPADPYSVNIWSVARGADIYVATGDDDTNWTVMIEEDPDVRLRIGTQIYELEARRVGDSREKRAVAAEYVSKYDLDAEDNWVLDGQVFRLDRR